MLKKVRSGLLWEILAGVGVICFSLLVFQYNLNILIPSDKNELKYLPVALALIAFRDSGQTLDTRYWLY